MNIMRDLLNEYEALLSSGEPVGRAMVTSVWGSAPRQQGASLLATPSGKLAGSVSGGCVESAAAQEIAAAIAEGKPRQVTFGVSNARAWEVGLACGGTIKLLVQPDVPSVVLGAARGEGGVVVATLLDAAGIDHGKSPIAEIRANGMVEHTGWPAWLVTAVAPAALDGLRREASSTLEVSAPEGQAVSVFLESYPRRPTLLIFGGVHIAMAMVPQARMLGFRTVVVDGRAAFLTRERFPEADELVLAWPEDAIDRVGIDDSTYVCILTHDPKFDEPATDRALNSPARYIGAIGAKKTAQARRERLENAGFTADQIARVRGPIGLDLGGRAPAEIALSILAEMTAVRYGKDDKMTR
jgi:xanthine dehydrogenase accessory factor